MVKPLGTKEQHKKEPKRPSARWPTMFRSGPGEPTAAEVLASIVVAAAGDKAPNLDLIVRLAIECASIDHVARIETSDRKHKKHWEQLRKAKDNADQRRWYVVARFLKH